MVAKAAVTAVSGNTSNRHVDICGALAHEDCPKNFPIRLEEFDNLDGPMLRHIQVYVAVLHDAREVQGSIAVEHDSGPVPLSVAHAPCFLSCLTRLVKHLL